MLDAASQTFLRVPKATLDILGAYGEALFRAIFGLELDSGKAWRRKSLGTGVYQPEDPWEVRDRLLEALPTTRGQAPKPFPGPLAADACTAALAAKAGPGTGVATSRAVSQFFLMGFEGDVRESGLKPSSAAGRAVGQAPKPFPGSLAADACTAALAAEAGPGVATMGAVSQSFLMGFEGDVRESGLKPSSAAGRAVGQAPKPFPGPLAADACTAALAAEAGPGTGVATLMGFEGDVRESGLKPSSAAGRAVGQAPKSFPGPLAADACTAALAAEAGPGVATLRAVS